MNPWTWFLSLFTGPAPAAAPGNANLPIGSKEVAPPAPNSHANQEIGAPGGIDTAPPAVTPTPSLLGYSGQVPVYQYPDLAIQWTGEANSDDDGSPDAYRPDNTGEDTNSDGADAATGYCGIALDPNGNPYIQGPNDPDPGAYVSTTSYQFPQFAVSDPRRYLNAQLVPFAVVPAWLRRKCAGVLMGCAGLLENLDNGMSVQLVGGGDIGPAVGEFSAAALRAIGVDPDPRNGGSQKLRYRCTLHPGTVASVNGINYPLIPA
jgi:hypothetical protein